MGTRTTRAICLTEYGGPEILGVSSVVLDDPAPGEIRVRQTAIGVNYHDVYVRSGLYRTLSLPGVPGIEAVGIVEQVGDGVTEFRAGDRIGYVSGLYGAYVEVRNLRADLALKLPDTLSDAEAAATLMKALTACMLLRKVRRIAAGEIILVHAAAGGMGQLLCRWASALGATVIGTVGSAAKAGIARGCGASEVILYREENVVSRMAELTDGRGAAAVYDAIGLDTFDASLGSLGICGHLVNYGQASGPVPPVALSALASKSLTISRPIVFHYIRNAELLREMADETFAALDAGVLRPIKPAIFAFDQVASAHRMLECAQSPGGIVLLP